MKLQALIAGLALVGSMNAAATDMDRVSLARTSSYIADQVQIAMQQGDPADILDKCATLYAAREMYIALPDIDFDALTGYQVREFNANSKNAAEALSLCVAWANVKLKK